MLTKSHELAQMAGYTAQIVFPFQMSGGKVNFASWLYEFTGLAGCEASSALRRFGVNSVLTDSVQLGISDDTRVSFDVFGSPTK
jgi:hypothetical protein